MRLSNILLLVAVLVVAITVYFVTRPVEESEPEPDPAERIWQFEMEELLQIMIELPKLDMSESFIKHEDEQWYFEDPSGLQVDPYRWGGGIPAILSGPTVERKVAEDATEERLAAFGLTEPTMKITLTKEDEEVVNIEIGDAVPGGANRYIRLADSNDVYTIVGSWYGVIERLVLEPPYPPEEDE